MVTLATAKTILINSWKLIKRHWKVVLSAILGAIFFVKAEGCYRRIFPPKQPNSGSSGTIVQPVLPKDVKEIIKVDNTKNTTKITTDKGTTTIDGSRETTIVVGKDGKIEVKSKTWGFCHNIALGAAVNNTGPKGTLGLEWFYWKRLDLLAGLGADKYLSNSLAFASLGYTPVNKIFHGNTSFWLGCSLDVSGTRSIITGFSVRI
jgi:hypothetical protein